MIIAYHAIWTTYGTWLPNDPRGSYSKEIYNEELKTLGEIKYGRQDPQPLRPVLRRFWAAALPRLERRPYFIDNSARPVIARAMGEVAQRLQLTVYRCAIMNDHIHLLVQRCGYRIEYLVNQFKGRATLLLGLDKTPWARKCWKVFIDDRETLLAAQTYVEMNPVVAGMAVQNWEFEHRVGIETIRQ